MVPEALQSAATSAGRALGTVADCRVDDGDRDRGRGSDVGCEVVLLDAGEEVEGSGIGSSVLLGSLDMGAGIVDRGGYGNMDFDEVFGALAGKNTDLCLDSDRVDACDFADLGLVALGDDASWGDGTGVDQDAGSGRGV